MMDREMIERALARFLYGEPVADDEGRIAGQIDNLLDIDALAEQAIVIECEVEQRASYFRSAGPFTLLWLPTADTSTMTMVRVKGHHGTPGKAIAIIVSLAPEG